MNASFGWSEKGPEIDVDVHDYDGIRPAAACLALKRGGEWLSLHLKSFDQIERLGEEIARKAREGKAKFVALAAKSLEMV